MKIGIITMHRVQNIGSVLQAYALQFKIRQLGYESELIDYVFPPEKKGENSLKNVASKIVDFLQGSPGKKKISKITNFRRDFLCCSEKSYNREDLKDTPPQYDLYCTGSDQVWNPSHVGYDTSFMLDFAPADAPRIAYASSFASKEVPEPFFSLYSKYIKQYDNISVREQAGVDIVKKMTGKEAVVACDPTLLLSKEGGQLSSLSNVKIKGGYILVYLMGYMFNPRPDAYNIIKKVQKALNVPVYFFNGFTCDRVRLRTTKYVGMGPADFVKLIQNATFVITDSFHGTAFATIYNKPMIGIVKDENNGDGRIATLRSMVDGKGSIVCYNQSLVKPISNFKYYQCANEQLEIVRNNSTRILKDMIENSYNSLS